MMRARAYGILRGISEKAARGADDATAMLVAGRERLDVELRRLRGEAERELCALSGLMPEGGLSAVEQILMPRLAGELCEVLECALEAAVLLRGRCVRAWGIFDRVRVSASLTRRLCALIAWPRGDESTVQVRVREFHEDSLRLATLSLQSFEDRLGGEESSAALLLLGVLDRWRACLSAAYACAVSLLYAG